MYSGINNLYTLKVLQKLQILKQINNQQRVVQQLKTIALSHENYIALKELGKAGDSFNDVISDLLRKRNVLQTSKEGDNKK
jgi:hypothetical protein